MENVKILNKETGHTFILTEEVAKDLIKSDRRSIFQVLDNNFMKEELEEEQRNEAPKDLKGMVMGADEDYENMKFDALKAYCAKHEINIVGARSKAEIIKRIKGE